MLLWRVCSSEKAVCVGSRGNGLSRLSKPSSGFRGVLGMSGAVVFTTRLRSLPPREESESSLEPDGVCGGDGGSDTDSVTVTCRRIDTQIVASAAISRAKDDERGVVVKTTK